MIRTAIRYAHTGPAKVAMLPGVSGTYAYSLFQVSLQEKVLPQTVQQLDSISSLLTSNPTIANTLNNPSLSLTERESLVKSLSDKSNNTFLSNFLTTLAQNNRLSYIPQINTDLIKLYDQYQGIVSVTLTTTKPFPSDQQRNKIGDRLSTAIKNSILLSKDQSIKFNYKVNPELLGGIVLEIGDKTIDLSVKSKVQDLNNSLKADL